MAVDPWLPERLRALKEIVQGEQKLYAVVLDILTRWAGKLRSAVFGPSGTVDPHGVFSTEPWFAGQVDDEIGVVIHEIVDSAAHDYADDLHPDAQAHVRDFLKGARNRLVRVPEGVYADIRAQTMKASTEGWSIDELQERVQWVLGEHGAEDWAGRARTIARTELIGAYNAGTFAGFTSAAKQIGGAWEKVWLATDDERTRPTHAHADGQRRPLGDTFRVGTAAMMFPGDPTGPADEVVNCRCSILMVRPGETTSYSNRQFKGAT